MFVCFIVYTALIEQLYRDKHITAEEASHLTATKLFTVPAVSSTTAVPSINITCSNTMVNSCTSVISHTDSLSVSVTQSVTTDQHISHLTSGLINGTLMSSNLKSVANGAFMSDQPAGTMEALGSDESSTNALITSTDGNDVQCNEQSLQSTNGDDDVAKNVLDNVSQHKVSSINLENETEGSSMLDTCTLLLAHDQQSSTTCTGGMYVRTYVCTQSVTTTLSMYVPYKLNLLHCNLTNLFPYFFRSLI